MKKALGRVPWWVWAAIAPAAIIGLVQLRTGGGVRTPYVVAGVGASLGEDDHPEGVYFTMDAVAHESFAATAERVEAHIREYPDMMVIGLDGDALEDTDESEREAMATLMTLAEHAENATTIPVLLSPSPSRPLEGSLAERSRRVHELWRREVCRGGEFRVCVDLEPHVESPDEVRAAIASGLVHGLEALSRWRASTQGAAVKHLLRLLALCLAFVAADGVIDGAGVRPPPEDGLGLWGVGLGAWPREARARGFAFPPDLDEVRALGANHVLVPITMEQETISSSTVGAGEETLSDADLAALVRASHRAGLNVTLMPLVEVRRGDRDHWRGVLRPQNAERWWNAYEQTLCHYADLAHRESVSTLVVGSELSSLATPAHRQRWARVSEAVRARFGGRLAWVSNHDALEQRAALEFVDVAGVSAYFPLADDPDAPPHFLERRFREITEVLATYQREVDLPLVLFEVGFPSIDGGAMVPWDYTSGAPIDLEEQRAAYAAVRYALTDADFVEGALFWGWFGPGGPHDRYYTPRGKPAERELAELLRSRAFPAARASLTAPPSRL